MKRIDSFTNHDSNGASRRTFLKLAAAVSGLAGVSHPVGAQPQMIELEGGIGHWHGVAPSSIEGEDNPTLDLEAGTTYRVKWTNIDGFDHNFVILDTDGNQVVRTKIISERGATQTVEFEATEDMTEYICEIHPNSMRGQVTIGGQKNPPARRELDIPMGATIGLETVADGLTAPLSFAVAPGIPDRQFVVDQTGQIYVLGSDGLADEPFLDISDRIVDLGVPRLNGYDERGLLGLAFHPDFQNTRTFYVHYSAPVREGTPENYDHTTVIAEFKASEDLSTANPDSERAIMEIPSPQMNHNGGDIEFGPDGYLYIGIGDGGRANDVGMGHVDDWYDRNKGGNGQDVTQNLLGSVLRIDVDSQERGKPYGIPDDNPLVGTEGLPEHYAWGFRNPRSISFNDGKLFVADAGQNLWEEVDIVEKGGNYGWNVKEATHCFSTKDPNNPPENCPDSTPDTVRGGEPLRDPIVEYHHRESTTAMVDGSVVIGGYVYGGEALPELQGAYVFGNWSGQGVVEPDGEIFVATPPDAGSDASASQLWSLEELVVAGTTDGQLNAYVLGFGEDQNGELYVLTSTEFTPTGSTGAVHKLVPAEGQQGTTTGDGETTTGEQETTTESATVSTGETTTVSNGKETTTESRR